jgi:hypothetical protein
MNEHDDGQQGMAESGSRTMNEHDDGGAAFPTLGNTGETADLAPDPAKTGMSLRDWFAGQANIDYEDDFPGSSAGYREAAKEMGLKPCKREDGFWAWVKFTARFEAILRYAKADAMLAERAKGEAK